MHAFFHRLSRRVHHRPWLRNTLGFSLVIAGIAGPLLPVLGIWMLPLGLFLLSADFPWAHRLHRRINDLLHRWTHRNSPPAVAEPMRIESHAVKNQKRQGDDR
jgi:hypothetical protein